MIMEILVWFASNIKNNIHLGKAINILYVSETGIINGLFQKNL